MIVQDESSNGSHSMHSRASQLDFVPSSQVPKQQYYKQQWKRKGADGVTSESNAKSRPVYKPPAVNKIKVIVLLEAAKLNESTLGKAIQAEFQQHEESPTDEKFQIRGVASPVEQQADSTPSENHLIRWTRSNLSAVDTLTTANIPAFEPFALLVAETEAFLTHMLASEDGYEFEQLGVYVESLFVQLKGSSTSYSKILALVDLDKAALKIQRKVILCFLQYKISTTEIAT